MRIYKFTCVIKVKALHIPSDKWLIIKLIHWRNDYADINKLIYLRYGRCEATVVRNGSALDERDGYKQMLA